MSSGPIQASPLHPAAARSAAAPGMVPAPGTVAPAPHSVGIVAEGAAGSCPHCGAMAAHMVRPTWVYAVGRLVPRFPDLGVEKEFAQAGAGSLNGALETERVIAIVKKEEFRYLARQLCWVLHNGDSEVLALVSRDDAEAISFADAVPTSEEAEVTVQVIVGSMALGTPDTACATGGLPSVLVDHHLTFTIEKFIDAIAVARPRGKGDRSEGKPEEDFRLAARDLFARLTRRSDNRGLSDEHRALNYIALRYAAVYHLAADALRSDKMLVEVLARRTQAGERRLVSVRLVFRGRRTDVVERYQCLVDVTDRFPFLSSTISQIYD